MSRPDLPDGQSLEEILASIRRSLTADDDPSEQGAEGVEAPAAQPEATNGGDPGFVGALRERLAKTASPRRDERGRDDDLADLLAPEANGVAVPPHANGAAQPTPAAEPAGRDPLWFLAKAPAPATPAGDPSTSRGFTEPAQEAEVEIKLSRPETLRASLPPLFGAGAPSVPAAAAQPAAAPVAEPEGSAADALDAAAPEFQDDDDLATVTFVAVKSDEPPIEEAEPAASAEPENSEPNVLMTAHQDRVKSVPEAEPRFWPASPQARETAAAAVAPLGEADPMQPDVAAPLPEDGPPYAAPGDDAAAAQTLPALEGMVQQLLQPMLRQWLDAHMPRMVEAALKEEVARAVQAASDATKKA